MCIEFSVLIENLKLCKKTLLTSQYSSVHICFNLCKSDFLAVFWLLFLRGGQGCGSALARRAQHDYDGGEGDIGGDGCRWRLWVGWGRLACLIGLMLVSTATHGEGAIVLVEGVATIEQGGLRQSQHQERGVSAWLPCVVEAGLRSRW